MASADNILRLSNVRLFSGSRAFHRETLRQLVATNREFDIKYGLDRNAVSHPGVRFG